MSEVSEKTEQLKGIIQRVTFHNENNGYTVAQLNMGGEEITVVGNMPFVTHGDDVTVYGEYTVHPVYGQQFKVSTMEKNMPTDSASLLRYLSTGAIKGIGPSTARKIVETFREETIEVLEKTPEKLAQISGISLAKAKSIGEEFAKQFGVREVMLLLARFKISTEDSIKAYKVLGTDAVNKIKANPYLLCGEKIDFSFEKAEDVAEYYNIPNDDILRVCAGVEYVLRKNSYNGHTCLPREKLVSVAAELLGVSKDTVEQSIDKLIEELRLRYTLVGNYEFVALPAFYNGEEYIATKLTVMASRRMNAFVDDREITFLEQTMGITFDEKQRQAVKTSLENSITLLTGGPGTGKTTTLKAMIEMFSHRDMEIELAAPTGRAAKRMSEVTGREAKTLHRLLEVEWTDEEKPRFARNERNPLECEVLILDEVSMVDTLLFESLLRALPLNTRLILVGDSDQLPSVSAGNVLGDIIDSDKFNVVRLDKVFRQAQESAIIRTAHDIIEDRFPDITVKDSDFFFMKRINCDETVKTLCDLYIERLPTAYGFEPLRDIQVLCPSRKMALGTVNLNNVLQDLLNPKKKNAPEVFFKGFFLREKDKVMQIKNNYELVWKKDSGEEGTGVFNGDVGYVEKIDKRQGSVTVRFEDKTVTYLTEELSQIELAYAVTVHKSQGSEYDCVILPLLDVPMKLKYRNLLYTAVTRAKKLLIVIGDGEVFFSMAENNKKSLRYTLLKEFLKVSYE
ncbi:MAG: ATP-dependent RecD-like DNA helicase [Ruminococcaceae bacterium]|nr:ATP-dependent RecD-like DNA helicase [Oscillospiraceae bacterium]